MINGSFLKSTLRSTGSGSAKNPMQQGDRFRVVVVDDHPVIRDALAETLGAKMDIKVVGQASSAEEALRLIKELRPDVAVVDISLEDAHGLDLVQNIRIQYPDTQIIVFSMYDESVYAERALRAGASGYLMKSEPTSQVAEAVRWVMRGEIFLSRRMSSRILNRMAQGRRGSKAAAHEEKQAFAIDGLTDREMAVFQMLGQGHGVEEIADRLSLCRKTVETYRRRAKEKLGFSTVAELLQFSVQWTYGQGIPQRASVAD